MPYQTLIYEKKDQIGTITLNRPERLNAISQALTRELKSLLDDLEKDDDVRVVILTGAPRLDGRPCFSAGGDLKEQREIGQHSALELGGTLEEGMLRALLGTAEGVNVRFSEFHKLWAFSKPTIAAVDGTCTGGGIELAISCDLRIAAETAEFSSLQMKNLGSMGGGGLQTFLPRLVGAARAKEMVWTGDIIDGKEAWRIGLANRVVPRSKLMEETRKLARQIAAMRPLGIKMSKMVINASLGQGIFESLRFSDFCHALTRYMTPKDQKESFAAFVEKRKPTFTGA